MTLKIHTKFKEKLNYGLENDMRNLANFHQSTQKFQTFMGSFYLSKKMNELKICSGLICYGNEEN